MPTTNRPPGPHNQPGPPHHFRQKSRKCLRVITQQQHAGENQRPRSSPVRTRPPPLAKTTHKERRVSLPAVFVAAEFRGTQPHRAKTPYLAGTDSDAWTEDALNNKKTPKLPAIRVKAASDRLSTDDAARREERRLRLANKVWEERDSHTRWNKVNQRKSDVEESVDRLFRGGMEWQRGKRERAAKLKADLEAPKGFRRYVLDESSGRLRETIQEFETLPREICAGKLQCQYYEGVTWTKRARLQNIERTMGPLDEEEKRLLNLGGVEHEKTTTTTTTTTTENSEQQQQQQQQQRSRVASEETVQAYVEKAREEYRAARLLRKEFEARDREFHKSVREAQAKWEARVAELDAKKADARKKARAEAEAWKRRRAELEAERAAEHRAAKKQLEEQRRAYAAKLERLKEAREAEYAARRAELAEQDRRHHAEQAARETSRAENARAWKISEREREKRLAEERAKPVDTELARERREWEAKYAELRIAEEKARAEEKIKAKQMMKATGDAYKAKLAEIGARRDAEIAERRKVAAEYERKIRAEEKAREAARLENVARARAEDRERKKLLAEKLAAKEAEAAAKARADFAVGGGAFQETSNKKARR